MHRTPHRRLLLPLAVNQHHRVQQRATRIVIGLACITLWFVPVGRVEAQSEREPGQRRAVEDAPPASPKQVKSAMRRAAEFYRSKVARHGGYVYYTTPDLQRRLGEGVASPNQIWVQPPGTPTVGMAYLKAYQATGDDYYLEAVRETATALIYGQLQSGAWTNCIDFDPRGSLVSRYRNGKGKGRNFSSLDDDQSQSAIRFLMRADRAFQFRQKDIHDSVMLALNSLLRAQFKNGAFPQGWDEEPAPNNHPPLKASFPEYDWRTEGRIKNYWDMYTLNDGLAGSVAEVLIEAGEIYRDKKFLNALTRFGDFLLSAQLPDPQPAWAQQYGYHMHPIWARKFEPAAVAGRESQDVLETLLRIYQITGQQRFLAPIPRAIAYLKRSQLKDGRLARYYELRSNRPLYMQRSGKVYSLTYDDSRLPNHYGWKCESRLDAIEFRYHSLLADRNYPVDGPNDREKAERVRRILASLDEQGRWISRYQGEPLVGQPKFRPGDSFLSSQVFSDNLSRLADSLK